MSKHIRNKYDGTDIFFIITISSIVLLILFILFVRLPVKLSTQSDCLERGYPEYKVTWNLQGYCISPLSNLGEKSPKVIKR